MPSLSPESFDAAYYQRYYHDPATRVADPEHIATLANFVFSYLSWLRVPVRRVLDLGCGIGLWRDQLARHRPQASYHGVEISPYLCERYGWKRGSVVDYQNPEQPFDLVICQGVLPYLPRPQLQRALTNLGQLSSGALYLEAVTREDFDNDNVDETLTDPRQHRHPARLYRRGLAPHFQNAGGGLWLSRQSGLPLFALEGCSD